MRRLLLFSLLFISACSQLPDISPIIQEFEEAGIDLEEAQKTEGFELNGSRKRVFLFDQGNVNIYSFSSNTKKEQGLAQLKEQLETADLPASLQWTATENSIILVLHWRMDQEVQTSIDAVLDNIETNKSGI